MKRVLATIMTAAVISGQMLFAGLGNEVNESAGIMEGKDYTANEQESAPSLEDWMISSPADAMNILPETEIATEAWMLQLIPEVQEPGILLENWMFDFHR